MQGNPASDHGRGAFIINVFGPMAVGWQASQRIAAL